MGTFRECVLPTALDQVTFLPPPRTETPILGKTKATPTLFLFRPTRPSFRPLSFVTSLSPASPAIPVFALFLRGQGRPKVLQKVVPLLTQQGKVPQAIPTVLWPVGQPLL